MSDFTGSPEILDGRVKTLHPKIHGGLLGRRDDATHREQMAANGIKPIDLVVVNLYPFEATVAKPGCTLEDAIENIDIGGPSMIRSAAKNHHDVDGGRRSGRLRGGARRDARAAAAPCRRDQRARLARARLPGHGALRRRHRRLPRLRASAAASAPFGETVHVALRKAQDLRYGENPHQKAALYGDFFAAVEQLHGKELSYNNIVDINAALWLMREFLADPPTVAILKHNTPCGVGTRPAAWPTAYRAAYATDPESPFGGILIANHDLDARAGARSSTRSSPRC